MSSRALILAALGGVLRFLCVPGFDLWPLAFVCSVPLLAACRGRGTRAAAVLGFVYGITYNLGGYHWLVETLRNFSGFPVAVCAALFLVLCLYQALEFALLAALSARAVGRGHPVLLAFPAAVATSELLFPKLFPSFLGYAPHQLTTFVQVAELGGPFLLTLIVAAANAALFTRGRRDLVLAGSVVGLTLAFGAARLPGIRARMVSAPRLTVGLVQANMGLTAKRDDPVEGLRRHVEQSEALEAEGPLDLIVWPESAFSSVIPEGVVDLREAVTGGGIETPVLFGGLRSERAGPGGRPRLYNSAFLADAQGRLVGSYDKTYLLAFGEYLPLGETFPVLYDWSPHTGRFSPGRRLEPLRLGEARMSVLICYEDVLPRFVRQAVRAAHPNLLVNLTNDGWYGKREPEIHLGVAKFRAIEQRLALVRATNTGVSALVDPTGQVTVRGGVDTRESLRGEVSLLDLDTLYASIGDLAGWLAGATSLLLCFGWRRGERVRGEGA